MLLSNKVAVITGGARGIGKGIVLRFAEEGCSTVIADVLVKEGERTAEEILDKGLKGLFVSCDVSNSFQVKSMTEKTLGKFGKIDVLVNNAGIAPLPGSISDKTEEEWDRVLNINLKGVFLCSKAVVPHMKEKKYGRIINISSTAAIAPPLPCIHYSASKAGVIGFTLDLALELAPFNICVNAILPGPIRTDLVENMVPKEIDKETFFAMLAKKVVPMQRMGTPEDIAGAALFLASDLSRFVTGDRIIVGGGAPLSPVLLLEK